VALTHAISRLVLFSVSLSCSNCNLSSGLNIQLIDIKKLAGLPTKKPRYPSGCFSVSAFICLLTTHSANHVTFIRFAPLMMDAALLFELDLTATWPLVLSVRTLNGNGVTLAVHGKAWLGGSVFTAALELMVCVPSRRCGVVFLDVWYYCRCTPTPPTAASPRLHCIFSSILH